MGSRKLCSSKFAAAPLLPIIRLSRLTCRPSPAAADTGGLVTCLWRDIHMFLRHPSGQGLDNAPYVSFRRLLRQASPGTTSLTMPRAAEHLMPATAVKRGVQCPLCWRQPRVSNRQVCAKRGERCLFQGRPSASQSRASARSDRSAGLQTPHEQPRTALQAGNRLSARPALSTPKSVNATC